MLHKWARGVFKPVSDGCLSCVCLDVLCCRRTSTSTTSSARWSPCSARSRRPTPTPGSTAAGGTTAPSVPPCPCGRVTRYAALHPSVKTRPLDWQLIHLVYTANGCQEILTFFCCVCVQVNPLAFWSFEDCWSYLRKHNVSITACVQRRSELSWSTQGAPQPLGSHGYTIVLGLMSPISVAAPATGALPPPARRWFLFPRRHAEHG